MAEPLTEQELAALISPAGYVPDRPTILCGRLLATVDRERARAEVAEAELARAIWMLDAQTEGAQAGDAGLGPEANPYPADAPGTIGPATMWEVARMVADRHRRTEARAARLLALAQVVTTGLDRQVPDEPRCEHDWCRAVRESCFFSLLYAVSSLDDFFARLAFWGPFGGPMMPPYDQWWYGLPRNRRRATAVRRLWLDEDRCYGGALGWLCATSTKAASRIPAADVAAQVKQMERAMREERPMPLIERPPVYLWLDDERPAPAGWTHARTFDEAVAILEGGPVELASLDHDLGDVDAARCASGQSPRERTGYTLCLWMAETGRWPQQRPVVHSANPVGRAAMVQMIERHWRAPTFGDQGKPAEGASR